MYYRDEISMEIAARLLDKLTELRDKNLVEYAGEYKDKETNRTVNLWKCN